MLCVFNGKNEQRTTRLSGYMGHNLIATLIDRSYVYVDSANKRTNSSWFNRVSDMYSVSNRHSVYKFP